MMDRDGKLTYSTIMYIDISRGLQLVVLPNPVVGNALNLSIYSPQNAKLQLTIYNGLSSLIYSEKLSLTSGSVNKTVRLSSLAAGTYIIRMTDGFSVQTAKFVKQ